MIKTSEEMTQASNGVPVQRLTGLAEEIIIRPLNLDDIWPVFQVGEMAFTSQRPNLYRFWDEVIFLYFNCF